MKVGKHGVKDIAGMVAVTVDVIVDSFWKCTSLLQSYSGQMIFFFLIVDITIAEVLARKTTACFAVNMYGVIPAKIVAASIIFLLCWGFGFAMISLLVFLSKAQEICLFLSVKYFYKADR
jgi:hypothetical protein